jgi:hypothetical protein
MPGVASAARPGFLVASGEGATVAVDAAGTTYIAYNDGPPGETSEAIGLCVIPRGAARCATNENVLDGAAYTGQPAWVSASGVGQLAIVSYFDSSAGDVELTSANGGVSFTAPVSIATLEGTDMAFGPAGQVLTVNGDEDDVAAQVGSLTAPDSSDPADLLASTTSNAFAGWAGGTPVVVAGSGPARADVAVWSGAGSVNDAATWRTERVGGETIHPSLASGPRGLFLLQDTGAFNDRLTIRRFARGRFGRAHIINSGSRATLGTALAEDPSGRLVAVWYQDTTERMLAAACADAGLKWSRPRVIGTDVPLPQHMRAAVGPHGRGWLVYDRNAGNQVRAIPLNVNELL